MKSKAHWTTVAGFWLGLISLVVAVVFGILEFRQDGKGGRRGKGKKPANTEVTPVEVSTDPAEVDGGNE